MSLLTGKTGFHQLGKGIYCYITEGVTMMSNCLLVEGEREALLFDVLCTRGLTAGFLEQCRAFTDKPIAYTVISHPHGDHFLGAAAVGDSVILTHRSAAESMDRERANPPFERLQKRQPHLDYSDAVIPVPQILLEDGCRIDLGGRVVELRWMGHCHTPSDLALFIPDAGVAALADVLFYGVVPATVAGDLDNWIARLAALQEEPYTTFLPGHGPVCGKAELETLRRYFLKVREQARRVEAGELTLCDTEMSPLEAEMAEAGWLETARVLFSTEQYAARLRGERYVPDMPRIFSLEQRRAALQKA